MTEHPENRDLLRSSAVAFVVAAVLVVIGCGVAQGAQGAFGAVLGVILVALFFGVDVVVYLYSPATAIRSATVVVLLYVLKLVVFAGLVVAVSATLEFDHGSFAVAVVVEALVASALAMRGYARMRVPYVEP